MSILISLLIFVVVVGIVFYILSLLPLPPPWLNIARAVVALIVLLVLLDYLGIFSSHAPVLHK